MENIKKRNSKKKVLVVAILFAFIAYYIGHPASLRSYISMYPTFRATDTLWVNKIAYRLASPERGDIVLAIDRTDGRREMPRDIFVKLMHPIYWSKIHYRIAIVTSRPTNVKRVIGMPGEIIELIDKQVFINGEKYVHGSEIFMDENFFPIEYDFETRVNMPAVIIPEKHFFLLGDHRDLSRDSRTFGAVHEDDITGKISLLIYFRRDGKIKWLKKINN